MRSSEGFSLGLFLATVFCLVMASPARAGLIISGGNATVAAGGTGTVDFTITSDNPSGDNLALFNLELQISVSSGTSFLQFTSGQPDPFGNASYVFSGSSGDQDSSSPFWGSPFSTNTANDSISGGDFNDSILGYTTIMTSSNSLLASVQFQADPNASAGDSFTIALVPDSSQTYFQDADGNNISYTSTDATVTVGSPSAVPAPPSLVLLGIGSLTSLAYFWGRRRKA